MTTDHIDPRRPDATCFAVTIQRPTVSDNALLVSGIDKPEIGIDMGEIGIERAPTGIDFLESADRLAAARLPVTDIEHLSHFVAGHDTDIAETVGNGYEVLVPSLQHFPRRLLG
ncbi:Hypothetical protein NGAL_HAMBI2610_42030 [Neorhizobium galegae bv. orientalis]|nr:Hypothetical protein NGAL_HAMBI2610_42030 [Neorhizobium galegae bv. orientalis]